MAPVQRTRKPRTPGPLDDPNVLGALDRSRQSYREATRTVGATAAACGVDLANITLSKSSMYRKRSQFRVSIGKFL